MPPWVVKGINGLRPFNGGGAPAAALCAALLARAAGSCAALPRVGGLRPPWGFAPPCLCVPLCCAGEAKKNESGGAVEI